MKKFILYPLVGGLALVLFICLTILLVVFFKPALVVNEASLKFALNKSKVLEKWSWNSSDMNIKWEKWNSRRFSGEIKDFCFRYDKPNLLLETCVEHLAWDLNLSWSLNNGFEIIPVKPLTLISSSTKIRSKSVNTSAEASPPPVQKYWDILWSKAFPPLNLQFQEIRILSKSEPLIFDLNVIKSRYSLVVKSMDYMLQADPAKITVSGPTQYKIPGDFKTKKPLVLSNLKITAFMKDKGIPLELTGDLEGFVISAQSYIDLPLKGGLDSINFKKSLLLNTSASLLIKDLKKVVHTYIPEPFDELPAPFNVLNGEVSLKVTTQKLQDDNLIMINTVTGINLEGSTQALKLSISGDIPVNIKDFARGSMLISVDLTKVAIQLPRLSKKEKPPQFFPDKRFKSKEVALKEIKEEDKTKLDLSFNLEALKEKALHVKTNLLEEPLRLNFDLKIRDGDIQDGYFKILPLKTTIFKRPIKVEELIVKFNLPKPPIIEGIIQFPLPEYKITMKLEGSVSDPQYVFSSYPPLPQNDIFAVLLFGRPLQDLDPDDKTAARQTNQILAQGVLSLSVLYFLAGSPVEYVGYDPESKRATAQIGLGRKSSLRVGAGEGGGVTGVRRSLGKGWYLDTSIQSTTNPSSEKGRNYGVLLERIIAY